MIPNAVWRYYSNIQNTVGDYMTCTYNSYFPSSVYNDQLYSSSLHNNMISDTLAVNVINVVGLYVNVFVSSLNGYVI